MNGSTRAYDAQISEKPQPAISGLLDAAKSMSEATAMVGDLADRLCGNQPSEVAKLDAVRRDNFFGQIEDCAGDLRDMTSRIMADVRRIQNRL